MQLRGTEGPANVADTFSAKAYVHSVGIVHRDVKLANMFMSSAWKREKEVEGADQYFACRGGYSLLYCTARWLRSGLWQRVRRSCLQW